MTMARTSTAMVTKMTTQIIGRRINNYTFCHGNSIFPSSSGALQFIPMTLSSLTATLIPLTIPRASTINTRKWYHGTTTMLSSDDNSSSTTDNNKNNNDDNIMTYNDPFDILPDEGQHNINVDHDNSNDNDSDETKLSTTTFLILELILPSTPYREALARRATRLVTQYASVLRERSSSSSSSSSSSTITFSTEMLSRLSRISSIVTELQKDYEDLIVLRSLCVEIAGSSSVKVNEEDDDDDGNEERDECINEARSIRYKMKDMVDDLIDILLVSSSTDNSSNGGSSNSSSDDDDNRDTYDAVLEVRAGTGGEEACAFAMELVEAYRRSCLGNGYRWKDGSGASVGNNKGLKEGIFTVTGDGAGATGGESGSLEENGNDSYTSVGPYGFLRFESGVHRVQRVPANDVRMQTSACSVAILPIPPRSNNNQKGSSNALPMSDLRIDTMKASGAGGQHVNTTDSAVRMTHIPTGLTISMQNDRSQHRNRSEALRLITIKVNDLLEREFNNKIGIDRKGLLGGGDRSERIRTYHYVRDSVVDHRSGVSAYGISRLLKGGGGNGKDNEENVSGGGGLVGTFWPGLRGLLKEEMFERMQTEEEKEQQRKVDEEKGKEGNDNNSNNEERSSKRGGGKKGRKR